VSRVKNTKYFHSISGNQAESSSKSRRIPGFAVDKGPEELGTKLANKNAGLMLLPFEDTQNAHEESDLHSPARRSCIDER
jgi:hypothetical protein